MRNEAYRNWLEANFAANTVATQMSQARRLEQEYGDLDGLWAEDRFEALLGTLSYSKADERIGRNNPSVMAIEGNLYNALSSYRTAINTYRKFLEDEPVEVVDASSAIQIAGELLKEKKEGKQFEIERHLQESLRGEIGQLEEGLVIIDGNAERSVESGFIDILAEDVHSRLVVIELKKGRAGREALGQMLGYMGDLKNEEPDRDVRGVLIAAEFDQSCRSALSIMPGLGLKRYRFAFTFEDA